jgi:hypothetical protein
MGWSNIILQLIFFVVPLCFLIVYPVISYVIFRFVKVKNIILKSIILLIVYYLMALAVINLMALILDGMLPGGGESNFPFIPWTSCGTNECYTQQQEDVTIQCSASLYHVFCNIARLLQFVLVGISLVGAGVFWAIEKILNGVKEKKSS